MWNWIYVQSSYEVLLVYSLFIVTLYMGSVEYKEICETTKPLQEMWTPLHYASKYCQIGVLRLLLSDAKIFPNMQDKVSPVAVNTYYTIRV